MKQISIWVLSVSFFLITQVANSVDDGTRASLVEFLTGLSNNNGQPDPSFDWNLPSDPCKDNWKGVICDDKNNSLVILHVTALCNVQSLAVSLHVLNLTLNNISGEIQSDIVNCKQLTRLLLGGNQFSGNVPDSLAMLSNLKQLDISNNGFSGDLTGLARISGLTMFLAQNNQFTGEILEFDFSNLAKFNVSNNFFEAPIPDAKGKFPPSCYLGNPELCGDILQEKCPPSKKKSKGLSKNEILMFSGYIALALVIVALILCSLKKKKGEKVEAPSPNKVASVADVIDKPSATSTEYKTDVSRSEFSVILAESAFVSSSLVVLTSPAVSDLKFEDLLRAPAGLLGRGKHGNQKGQKFEWASRHTVAAKIAEALAFMHQELHGDGIAHGNLKSSDIMLKRNMEPCISEDGLMVVDRQEPSSSANVNGLQAMQQTKDSASNAFKADIYGFVVREEWTVEVFDESLISEDASEERMLNLLQVAIKCVNRYPEARPSINQVVSMINTIKEEEDKSLVHEP
ncbi:hypothetical protein REPUB_Repub10bG0032900 [Reevesia pubescens]